MVSYERGTPVGFSETGNDLAQFACDIGDDIEFKANPSPLAKLETLRPCKPLQGYPAHKKQRLPTALQ